MIGKQFVSALLEENSVGALLQFGPIDHLFKASEAEVFDFVREFVKKYQKLPTSATITTHTGESLVPHAEPPAYYFDLMQLRHTEIALKIAMQETNKLLLPSDKDPEAAMRTMTEAIMELTQQHANMEMADFRQAYDLVVQAYSAKQSGSSNYGLQLGWPKFDALSGGLGIGDVVSMVGRPAMGKTWQMLYSCHNGWNKAGDTIDPEQNHSRLFVSMEMGTLAIQQRLASMHSHTAASELKLGALTTLGYNKLKSGLTSVKGFAYPFWVMDGNLAATVEDIYMLARQIKPGAIFIDGAYLLKHPSERDRYRRVAENADLIKQELSKICPTVCSWQFAKTAAKKNAKKGEKVGLEDVGYTDAIAQVSSIVLGLFEDESVETIKQRKIDILKGRNGETGEFRTNWRFDTMDFSEIIEEDVSELQFL